MIELLTTIAALVLVLGLMVSLARHVRGLSASRLTKDILARAETVMRQYEARHGELPQVPVVAGTHANAEAALREGAVRNSRAFVDAVRGEPGFAELMAREAMFDGAVLRDAWGQPIVFVPRGAASVRMSPQQRWFFFSAGPDRTYSTLEDNYYSYEQAAAPSRP